MNWLYAVLVTLSTVCYNTHWATCQDIPSLCCAFSISNLTFRKLCASYIFKLIMKQTSFTLKCQLWKEDIKNQALFLAKHNITFPEGRKFFSRIQMWFFNDVLFCAILKLIGLLYLASESWGRSEARLWQEVVRFKRRFSEVGGRMCA